MRCVNCNRLKGRVEGCWAGGQDCADAAGAWNRALAEEIERVRAQHDSAWRRIDAALGWRDKCGAMPDWKDVCERMIEELDI